MIPVTHSNGFCTGLPTVVNSSCHKSSWTFRSSTWKDRWRRKRRLLSKITAVCRWKVQIRTNGYKASKEVFESIKTLKRLPLMQPLLFLSCQVFVLINLVCLELKPWPRGELLSRNTQLPPTVSGTVHLMFYGVLHLRCSPVHSLQ